MDIRKEWKWLALVAAVCFVAFAASVNGDWVYDDTRQIVRNPLIQNPVLAWKALTSDVWAFKGDGTVVASNYWRPTFTAWGILNFRLFGLASTPWHILNMLLHAGVCCLAFALLRRWGFSTLLALAVTLIFAVHPTRVETVSWISGAPDLLFSLAFLGSLWFAHTYARTRTSASLWLMALLYAVALGSKEIGIVCLPIYYFVFSLVRDDQAQKGSKAKQAEFNTPLLILGSVAVVYFLVRLAIIGTLSRPPENAPALGQVLMSLPEMFAFYLRQTVFPYWIAGNYPIAPVEQIAADNFILPLLASAAALTGIYFLARNDVRSRLAAAIFLLPLIPAMNATAFSREEMVHDRYLYLPLLGALMLIATVAAKYLSERYIVIGAAAAALLLSVQTFSYSKAWTSDMALWSWNKTVDTSAFTSMQYASTLADAGQHQEAIAEYTDSIEKAPRVRAYLGRGRSYIKVQNAFSAERDLKQVTQTPIENIDLYTLYQAYEALSVLYSETGNFKPAAKALLDGREKLPIYYAALTTKMAVVLYQAGQKNLALMELEGARAQARKELLPESKTLFMRLGMLYNEMGRKDEARAALREFLSYPPATNDADMIAARADVQRILDTDLK